MRVSKCFGSLLAAWFSCNLWGKRPVAAPGSSSWNEQPLLLIGNGKAVHMTIKPLDWCPFLRTVAMLHRTEKGFKGGERLLCSHCRRSTGD